jgi:hypothetical protein
VFVPREFLFGETNYCVVFVTFYCFLLCQVECFLLGETTLLCCVFYCAMWCEKVAVAEADLHSFLVCG